MSSPAGDGSPSIGWMDAEPGSRLAAVTASLIAVALLVATYTLVGQFGVYGVGYLVAVLAAAVVVSLSLTWAIKGFAWVLGAALAFLRALIVRSRR